MPLMTNFSIGAGLTTIVPHIRMKFSGEVSKNVYIGIAVRTMYFPTGGGVDNFGGDGTWLFGTAYGIMTVGNLEKNISVSAGALYGIDLNGTPWQVIPMISLNGSLRITKKLSFMMENVLGSEEWPFKEDLSIYNEIFYKGLYGFRYYMHNNKVALSLAIPFYGSSSNSCSSNSWSMVELECTKVNKGGIGIADADGAIVPYLGVSITW